MWDEGYVYVGDVGVGSTFDRPTMSAPDIPIACTTNSNRGDGNVNDLLTIGSKISGTLRGTPSSFRADAQ